MAAYRCKRQISAQAPTADGVLPASHVFLLAWYYGLPARLRRAAGAWAHDSPPPRTSILRDHAPPELPLGPLRIELRSVRAASSSRRKVLRRPRRRVGSA